MSMRLLDAVALVIAKAEGMTVGDWHAARLTDDEGSPLRGEKAVEYVETCIRAGNPDADFYAVYVEKPDGTYDVCHTGNGPDSPHNARVISCVPDLLRVIKAMAEAIRAQQEIEERQHKRIAAAHVFVAEHAYCASDEQEGAVCVACGRSHLDPHEKDCKLVALLGYAPKRE